MSAVEPDPRPAASGAGEHEWVRLVPWWHAAFAATVVFSALWAGLEYHHHPDRLGIALTLFAVLAGWYVVAPGGPCRGNTSVAYLVGALAIFAVAAFVYPGTGFLCFILIPQCFFFLEQRAALVAVVGLTLVTAASELNGTPITKGNALTIALFGCLTLGLSVFLGAYVTRIAEQSKQRAELIDELDRTRAELAALSREAGMRAERERLAGEIHDTLAQGFTSILVLMQAARAALEGGHDALQRQLDLAESTAREGLAEARSLVTALGPVALQSASLSAALRRLVDDFSARSGVRANLTVVGDCRDLPTNAEIVLLRAAQEALTNVYRHARAARAEVTLCYGAPGSRLVVADDGRGFDPAGPQGYGLAGMRARVEQLGGHLEVDTRPGEGSTVTVVIP